MASNNQWKIFKNLQISESTSSDSDSDIPETAQSSNDKK